MIRGTSITITGILSLLLAVTIILWTFGIFGTHKPTWHYVPAGSDPAGIQGWYADQDHVVEAVTCIVYASTSQDPSPITARFDVLTADAFVNIRIISLEAWTSKQGDIPLEPVQDAELFMDTVNDEFITWTHPTPITTDLHSAGANAETLRFTIRFEIDRFDRTSEHTMTYEWIPRRY